MNIIIYIVNILNLNNVETILLYIGGLFFLIIGILNVKPILRLICLFNAFVETKNYGFVRGICIFGGILAIVAAIVM